MNKRLFATVTEMEPVAMDDDLAPALRMHALLYARRPDVNAIVHLHSHHVTVLSSLGTGLGMYGVAAVLFLDEQVLYADDGVKPHVSVVEELGEGRVAWMKNHGALIASQSLEQAVVEAVTLEIAARLHLDCVAHGGTEIVRAEAEGRPTVVPAALPGQHVARQCRPDPRHRSELCAGIGENRTG